MHCNKIIIIIILIFSLLSFCNNNNSYLSNDNIEYIYILHSIFYLYILLLFLVLLDAIKFYLYEITHFFSLNYIYKLLGTI